MDPNQLQNENDKPPPYSPQQEKSMKSYTDKIIPDYPTAPQPPPGYYPGPSQFSENNVPNYGATTNSTTLNMPQLDTVGACPACRIGVLEDDYTCLGIFCAIFLFPCGIICCRLLKSRRCSNCGIYYD